MLVNVDNRPTTTPGHGITNRHREWGNRYPEPGSDSMAFLRSTSASIPVGVAARATPRHTPSTPCLAVRAILRQYDLPYAGSPDRPGRLDAAGLDRTIQAYVTHPNAGWRFAKDRNNSTLLMRRTV